MSTAPATIFIRLKVAKDPKKQMVKAMIVTSTDTSSFAQSKKQSGNEL